MVSKVHHQRHKRARLPCSTVLLAATKEKKYFSVNKICHLLEDFFSLHVLAPESLFIC